MAAMERKHGKHSGSQEVQGQIQHRRRPETTQLRPGERDEDEDGAHDLSDLQHDGSFERRRHTGYGARLVRGGLQQAAAGTVPRPPTHTSLSSGSVRSRCSSAASASPTSW
jgi:hypothetical protein